MKTRQLICIGALASAACVTGSASAADARATTTQIQNGPLTTAPVQNHVSPDARSVGTPAPQWSDYDVPTNFPTRNLSLPPRTGSDVIPDYMGPGSVRGQ